MCDFNYWNDDVDMNNQFDGAGVPLSLFFNVRMSLKNYNELSPLSNQLSEINHLLKITVVGHLAPWKKNENQSWSIVQAGQKSISWEIYQYSA